MLVQDLILQISKEITQKIKKRGNQQSEKKDQRSRSKTPGKNENEEAQEKARNKIDFSSSAKKSRNRNQEFPSSTAFTQNKSISYLFSNISFSNLTIEELSASAKKAKKKKQDVKDCLPTNKTTSDFRRGTLLGEIPVFKDMAYKSASQEVFLGNNPLTLKDKLQGCSKNQSSYKAPVKIIEKIKTLSEVGYSPGAPKINQDYFFNCESFANKPNRTCIFSGVCDGHGTFGHHVSKYVCTKLPRMLSKEAIQYDVNTMTPKFRTDISKVFSKLQIGAVSSNFNCQLSGTTCCSVILTQSTLISINLGDSRAVLAKKDEGGYVPVEITHDQKPDNPEEKRRIIGRGGRVRQMRDPKGNPIGPMRVWLNGENIPGLAMSRSIGDTIAVMAGTICEPEVKVFDLAEEDAFVVIASDGVWEFIDNKECVEIVGEFYPSGDSNGAAHKLMEVAKERWSKNEETRDDITLTLIFLKDLAPR